MKSYKNQRAEQCVAVYAPQAARPQNADVGTENNIVKTILTILATCTALALIAPGCATCTSDESPPGIRLDDRNDPYMYWICLYYRDANGRWPTNTPDLVEFLQNDYTNMVQEIERNYRTTKYVVSPEGWLMLETKGHKWSENKRVLPNMLESGNTEKK